VIVSKARAATVVVVALVGVVGWSAPAFGARPAKGSPMSKSLFIKTGDDVCRQGNQLVGEAVARVLPNIAVTPTAAQLAELATAIVPVYRQELQGIRALVPPKADQSKIKKMLDSFAAGVKAVQAHSELLLNPTTNRSIATSAKLAKSYGFLVCGTF
jgi:hypothetical protein